MGITSALVLLAITWFMVLLIILPLRNTSQGEAGRIVPGTHASAPDDFRAGRKAWITTLIAVPIWLVLVAVILSGWITLDDIDVFDRCAPDRYDHSDR